MIDRTNKMLRIKSIANAKNKEDGKLAVIGNDETLKAKFFLRKLTHPDLYDCIPPINEYDVEYSILSKYYAIKRRRERKVLNLRMYIPVSKVLTDEDHYNYDYYDTIDLRFKDRDKGGMEYMEIDEDETPLWL